MWLTSLPLTWACVLVCRKAYTSRRAERTLAEQAQEQHTHEIKRQREHEQMLAQIARTDRCECPCYVALLMPLCDVCGMDRDQERWDFANRAR